MMFVRRISGSQSLRASI